MARKLIDIRNQIDSSGMAFRDNLEKSLNKDVLGFLNKLSRESHVYIFSGIIRNYFLKIDDYRDVDVFIDGILDIEKIISDFEYKRNSFGGYKIMINNTKVDLWTLQDTWAINNSQTILDIEIAKHIPRYAFFNFSSILFSYNENKFYYTNKFVSFLQKKEIDLVFAPNANEALCVVNSLYYSDKLNLKLGVKLIRHIKKIYKNNLDKCEEVQMKHFGEIIYNVQLIEDRINAL